MRRIEIEEGKLLLQDEVIGFIEKTVTPFGNSAKVDVPKQYIGRRAYVAVCRDREPAEAESEEPNNR